ncbi:MAG TPA: hotdog fold thioesterase [Actinotalea sp.]|jgi:uncharacterized protein (TIGR00369 family)
MTDTDGRPTSPDETDDERALLEGTLPPEASAVLAQIRAENRGTLVERLGIEVIEASPGLVVGIMPVEGNTQPYGLLHGGASVALAETLGSYGAMLHAGPGRQAVGIEVSATHHRAARSGIVTGRAVALHLGSTVASYEIVVEDSTSRRVCTARLTCLLMAARRPD